MDISIGKLEPVDPRTLWGDEARDFTPWLAQNIGLLGDALGIDLELVEIETPVGSFSCDIHARDLGRDRPVIIENQLEATDHDHLGKLLTYAAGLDAAVIVWISTKLREEHRETLDWLNRHTDDRVEFFGISLEAIRIDGSKPAVQFRLAAFPNAWSKPKAVREVSEIGQLYQQFYQTVVDELREKHKFTNARIAQPQNWYSFKSGISSVSYNATFAKGSKLRAEVYIDFGDAPQNKSFFDALFAKKDELEMKIGEPLEWERLDTRRACRIALVRPNTTIEDATTHGEEMQRWLVTSLLKMRAAFGPLIVNGAK
ncbi:MAG: DUF4268 domain-containing protein [Reyranella sp.]|nr:DUF4268 domain-containing protein [Reyranella sp.]